MRSALALIASLALALLNLLALVGAGYANVAERRLDSSDISAPIVAAGIAARAQPWSSDKAALQGWAFSQGGQPEAADAAYLDALRLAPADSLVWAEYALARTRSGRFDSPLTQAMAQAQRLAPQSPAIQAAIADLGVSYWPHGNPEQRALWLDGMRYELAHERASFLARVLARGRGRTFCSDAAGTLGEINWCGATVR